jgi:hypothetical protein
MMVKMRRGTRKSRTTANLYRYVIDHDMGFSPNPFHGICTLANCKPEIRRTAMLGDFVLGFGSAASDVRGKLIYWLRIDELTIYDDYWEDPRFQNKKPVVNGSHLKFHGDNIYHHDSDGVLIQEPSFHSLPDGAPNPKNVNTDTNRTNRVIISNTFGYYGKEAIALPANMAAVVPRGRGHRVAIDKDVQEEVINWLLTRNERGFIGEPSGWKKIKT